MMLLLQQAIPVAAAFSIVSPDTFVMVDEEKPGEIAKELVVKKDCHIGDLFQGTHKQRAFFFAEARYQTPDLESNTPPPDAG